MLVRILGKFSGLFLNFEEPQWLSLQSVRLGIKGLLVDSPQAELLCCVLEQDTFLCLVLVQPRRTGNLPDMTEKLLTGI